jgi:hypothetical protein
VDSLDKEILDQVVAPYATLCMSVVALEGEKILEILLKAHFPCVSSDHVMPYRLLAKYALANMLMQEFEASCFAAELKSEDLIKYLKGCVL